MNIVWLIIAIPLLAHRPRPERAGMIRRWVGRVLVAIRGLTATVGEAGQAAGRLLERLFRR